MPNEKESAAFPEVRVRRLRANGGEEKNPLPPGSKVATRKSPRRKAAVAPDSTIEKADVIALKMRLRQLERSVQTIRECQDRLAVPPLAQPIRFGWATRLLRAGARTLRRSRVELIPAPSFDVETTGDEWLALSDASEVSLGAERIPVGWVRLSMKLEGRGDAVMLPRLLVQVAGAPRPVDLALPSPVDGRLHVLLEVPRETVGLKLRPSERAAAFRISDVLVTEVTAAELAAHAANRLVRSMAADPSKNLGSALEMARAIATANPGRAAALLRKAAVGTVSEATTYAEWARRYVEFTDQERRAIREWIDAFPKRPLVSIHVAATRVCDPIAAIAAMKRQLYPHWELLVSFDSTSEVQSSWAHAARGDARVRLLDGTAHPIDAARGDLFVAPSSDFHLADHALALFTHHLATTGDAAVTFDEEVETEKGIAPVFRPLWDEDLFLGNDYVRGAVCFTRSFLLRQGRKPEGVGTAFAFNALVELVGDPDAKIGHLPFVLARRKVVTSMHPDSAMQAVLDRHASTLTGTSITRGLTRGTFRLMRRRPERPPLVSLIIPTRDKQPVLELAVESLLLKTRYPNFELIVVDNQSREQSSLKYLRDLQRRPKVRVLRYREPFNYAAINNVACAASRGEVIGLLNNDLEIISGDWLDEMVAHAMRPEVGAVGAKLYYPDQTIQHGGVTLGLDGVAAHLYRRWARDSEGSLGRLRSVHQTSAVTGACLVTRRDVYDRLGGLDEKNLPIAFNDVDFCLRVREAGLRVVWTPYAELFHHESLSRGPEDTPEKLARFAREIRYMDRRWGALLKNDPFYSPNLSLQGTDLRLAFPPRVRAPWLSTPDLSE